MIKPVKFILLIFVLNYIILGKSKINAFIMSSISTPYSPSSSPSVAANRECISSTSPSFFNSGSSNKNRGTNLSIAEAQANTNDMSEKIEEKSDVFKNSQMGRRVPFVGGNWKCNGNKESVAKLVALLNNIDDNLLAEIDVVVAPPAIHIPSVQNNLNKKIDIACQDVSIYNNYGAFTGELCAKMIKDSDIDWCIVGHSERRQGFGMNGETDEIVGKKVKSALSENLNVIACIGEKLQDREEGKTLEVIQKQISSIISNVNESEWKNVVIAYEPVWAIGTGKTATPNIVQDVHKAIREMIASKVSEKVANEVRILYGGSVKGNNSGSLIVEDDVDGFLVGGASLTDDFVTILNEISKSNKFENINASQKENTGSFINESTRI